MSEKKNGFKFRFPEFLLIGLLLTSNVILNFSGGGFILDIKKIGFTAFSTVEKGVHFVVNGISDTFSAVKELKRLRKDYNDLVVKLENYEKMQRTNADIRKENERLKESYNLNIDKCNERELSLNELLGINEQELIRLNKHKFINSRRISNKQ